MDLFSNNKTIYRKKNVKEKMKPMTRVTDMNKQWKWEVFYLEGILEA